MSNSMDASLNRIAVRNGLTDLAWSRCINQMVDRDMLRYRERTALKAAKASTKAAGCPTHAMGRAPPTVIPAKHLQRATCRADVLRRLIKSNLSGLLENLPEVVRSLVTIEVVQAALEIDELQSGTGA